MAPNQVSGLTPLSKAFSALSATATVTAGSLSHLATQPFSALQRAIGAVQSQIVQFVQFANPAAVIRFRMATEDLNGVIGRALGPALRTLTLIVQQLANYLNAAEGPAKGLIAAMAVTGVVVAAVTGGFIGMTGALIVLKLVLDAFTGGITAVVGLVGAALGGIAAGSIGTVGLGISVLPFQQVQEIINQIGPPLLKIFNMVGAAVMNFATGVIPGLMTGIDAISSALRTFVSGLPGAGSFFTMLGKAIGAMIVTVSVFVQGLSVAFKTLSDVIAYVTNSLGLNVNVFKILNGAFDKLLAILMAVSMVLGEQGTPDDDKKPGRAPPAVRQATSQSISSFVTKAYVSAFQTGGGADPAASRHAATIDKMKEIEASAKEIAANIKEFLTKVSNTANTVASTTTAVASTASGVAGAAVPGYAAVREMMSWVTGK